MDKQIIGLDLNGVILTCNHGEIKNNPELLKTYGKNEEDTLEYERNIERALADGELDITLIDEIGSTLEALKQKDYMLVVYTSCTDAATEGLVKKAGLEEFFKGNNGLRIISTMSHLDDSLCKKDEAVAQRLVKFLKEQYGSDGFRVYVDDKAKAAYDTSQIFNQNGPYCKGIWFNEHGGEMPEQLESKIQVITKMPHLLDHLYQ